MCKPEYRYNGLVLITTMSKTWRTISLNQELITQAQQLEHLPKLFGAEGKCSVLKSDLDLLLTPSPNPSTGEGRGGGKAHF